MLLQEQPMPDAEVRAQIQSLWTANFLNIRRATEEARSQARTRLDVAFELLEIALTPAGEFHPYAAECLGFLSRNSFFALHLWTFAKPEQVVKLSYEKLSPANIHVRGQNENPLRKNVNWDARKPWFDVLLDRTSGLDPAAGHWYWAQALFQISAESLSSTRSGATIIRNADRFMVTTAPHTRSGPGLG
jgi:hypothetical protein